MSDLRKYNLNDLKDEELPYINGGGERYAYYFGKGVTYSLAFTVFGVAGLVGAGLYDYNN